MRRGLGTLIIFLLLATISFARAAGLSDILNSIDEPTLVLFSIFLIVFVILFFSLKKVFKGDVATPGVVSVFLALLITYAANKSGFDIQGLFFNIGISQDILSTAIPIVILIGVVLLIIFLAKNSLLAIGGLLILVGVLQIVYAWTIFIIIGVILVVVRFLIPKGAWEMRRKEKPLSIRLR